MSENYYSIDEFKKLDYKSKHSIIYHIFQQEYSMYVKGKQGNLCDNCLEDFVEAIYPAKQLKEYISNTCLYHDSSFYINLYRIIEYARKHQENVYEIIIRYYLQEGKRTCLTNYSEMTKLLIKLGKIIEGGKK